MFWDCILMMLLHKDNSNLSFFFFTVKIKITARFYVDDDLNEY